MASLRDIKQRKGSIQSTQQITRAMKLVSTVKLQKARAQAETVQPYFDCMYRTVTSMLARSGNFDHPYLKGGGSPKKAVVVLSSNRGLAGGYNMNVAKLLTESGFSKENVKVYAVGRKAREILERKGYEIAADYSQVMEGPVYGDAAAICGEVLGAFTGGQIGEIYLAYTRFQNTVSHVPTLLRLLPVAVDGAAGTFAGAEAPGASEKAGSAGMLAEAGPADPDAGVLMNYEPSQEQALNLIIPKYVASLIYGALTEAVASENGARMQAMDSATGNAQEMIEELTLRYNRARQSNITQELTEIIAGAEALS